MVHWPSQQGRCELPSVGHRDSTFSRERLFPRPPVSVMVKVKTDLKRRRCRDRTATLPFPVVPARGHRRPWQGWVGIRASAAIVAAQKPARAGRVPVASWPMPAAMTGVSVVQRNNLRVA